MSDPTPGRWLLDSAASTVTFEHKSLWGLVNVKGTFSDVSGEGELSADGTGSGTVTIAAGSLNTKHGQRDKHLRSADFFHVESYPTFTFAVRSATPGANGTVQVAGDLTVRETTRPLTFTARATELTADAATLTAELQVDRAWFGMNWNMMGSLRGLATVKLTTRFNREATAA
jgi:polyisoprenoid-binding protein YceI